MVSLKETSYLLKIFQLAVAFLILLLEFVLAVGFKNNYYDEPTHNAHFFYWVTLITQNLYLLHLVIRFRPHWQHGVAINRIISDCITILAWLSICLANISPAIKGVEYNCSDKSGSSLTRCQLFLTNFSLGWILIPTLIGSLLTSIIRWRNDQLISSSIPMSKVNNYTPPTAPKPSRPPSYTMKEGVLDGQPVLIFNDNNNKRMSFYNQRNSSNPHMRPLSYPNNAYNIGSTPNLMNISTKQSERDSDSKSVNI